MVLIIITFLVLIMKFYISDSDAYSQLESDSLEERFIPQQLASENGSGSDDGSLGGGFGNDGAEGFDLSFSDSEEEKEPEPLPILDVLNRFCLKVKEEAMISNKAVERIRSVTISLLKTASKQSKAQVTKILQDNGIDPTNISGLQDAFLPVSSEHGSCELNDHGDYSSHFTNIAPREIVLGQRREWKRLKNGKRRVALIPERFYYVSLLASLEVLLNNQNILDMVAHPKVNKLGSSLLCDFNDGPVVQSHELFATDPQSLKIILYYDDVEIINEHTKRKHKLAMFYFQLANLYPEYRSKLKLINLVAIVEYRYLKKHGMDKILAPFIEDLKRLGRDTVVDLKVHGGVVRLRGALLAVIADTPASQLLGEYKESVGGAKRKCRHCMTAT